MPARGSHGSELMAERPGGLNDSKPKGICIDNAAIPVYIPQCMGRQLGARVNGLPCQAAWEAVSVGGGGSVLVCVAETESG